VTDQVDYLLSNPFEFNEGNLVAWYRLVSIVPFFFSVVPVSTGHFEAFVCLVGTGWQHNSA
jgi:hypothetical protein